MSGFTSTARTYGGGGGYNNSRGSDRGGGYRGNRQGGYNGNRGSERGGGYVGNRQGGYSGGDGSRPYNKKPAYRRTLPTSLYQLRGRELYGNKSFLYGKLPFDDPLLALREKRAKKEEALARGEEWPESDHEEEFTEWNRCFGGRYDKYGNVQPEGSPLIAGYKPPEEDAAKVIDEAEKDQIVVIDEAEKDQTVPDDQSDNVVNGQQQQETHRGIDYEMKGLDISDSTPQVPSQTQWFDSEHSNVNEESKTIAANPPEDVKVTIDEAKENQPVPDESANADIVDQQQEPQRGIDYEMNNLNVSGSAPPPPSQAQWLGSALSKDDYAALAKFMSRAVGAFNELGEHFAKKAH